MPAKKYTCTNFADCDKALGREVLEIAEGAEPDCPHADCRKYLIEVKDQSPVGKWIKPAGIALSVVVVVGGLFFWSNATKSPPRSSNCNTTAMESAYKSDDCQAVIKLGSQCLANLPNDATVLNNVAVCLLKNGYSEKAGEMLQRALALKPNDPYLHYNQAAVDARKNGKQEAVSHLKKACQLGLAPATFRQDPDFASLAGYASFEDLVKNKNCQ